MPFVKSRYPENWKAISRAIRERAGQRCECSGQCGDHAGERCDAPNGARIHRDEFAMWQWTECEDPEPDDATPEPDCGPCQRGQRSVCVVLTCAHLDHGTADNSPENLLAMCNRCHLKYDATQHAKNARATRRSRKAIGELPGTEKG